MSQWRTALAALPATPNNIPAFFFAHGSPALASPSRSASFQGSRQGIMSYQGPDGPLAEFLRAFGPALLEKYKPKGIVVFSAHWETYGERLVTDYGAENPLLMDYYGFPAELYKLKFTSRSDTNLAERVVSLFKAADMKARTTPRTEPRGSDGRGFDGPGLDHGVFVPFRLMFGEVFTDIPIVQASIDSTLKPDDNWKVGEAVRQLRKEGILVLSGGLTVHNLRDFSSFHPDSAGPLHKSFDKAIHEAIAVTEPEARKQALFDLTRHPGFRAAHPREDHFVPLYVAGGAGKGDPENNIPEGQVKTIVDLYGLSTFAFGVTDAQ